MIRNDAQLVRAEARLKEIREQLLSLESRYLGSELVSMKLPLVNEAESLEAEINEYKRLRALSLKEAVLGPLKSPVLLEKIGDLLTKLRIAAGFTQEEFASQLGWQQSNLSRFESENYRSHTISKIIEYSSNLGVWLHVVPSLIEQPTEIVFTKHETPLYTSDFGVTAWIPAYEIKAVAETGPGKFYNWVNVSKVGTDDSTIEHFHSPELQHATALST